MLKKVRPTDRPMTTPLFLLRCVQLGISIRDLDLLAIGLVNDMYAENSNDDDKGYKEGAWVLNGVTGLNLSQTAMTNWSAGGENALSGNAYLNGSLTHKNGNWLWVTNLILDYGLSKTKSQEETA